MRTRVVVTGSLAVVLLVACGTSTDMSPSGAATDRSSAAPRPAPSSARAAVVKAPASSTPATTSPRSAALPAVLATTGGMLSVHRAGSDTVVWSVRDAMAAPDGSVAYTLGGTELVELDVVTGSRVKAWPLPSGAWRVAVVSPTGRWVSLVDASTQPTATGLAVIDTTRATTSTVRVTGTLEPEAISVDGRRVFVLHHRPGHYRVRVVDVATGQINDVFGRNKSEAEDMTGTAIRAVLNPAGDVLATLYRDPVGGHPFIHVLHLANGWSYCADLPRLDYQRIANSADGRTVYVGTVEGPWAALDLSAFGQPGLEPLELDLHASGTPPVPLADAGTVSVGDLTVTADQTGVTWWQGRNPVGHVNQSVDRLIGAVTDLATHR